MYPNIRIVLCCLLLGIGAPLAAQDQSGQEEAPGLLDRFLAIFQRPDTVKSELLDSLQARNAYREQSVSERYDLIYNLIHREQQAYYRDINDSTKAVLAESAGLDQAKYVSPKGDTILRATNVKVFGWHPHWMGGSYESYNFHLLSHVGLFSYNVNVESGKPYDNPEVVEAWETDPDFKLIDLAHEAGCKVMLTITNFGERENRIFLRDTLRQNRLIDDVVSRLVRLEADGIDLDFELIPPNYDKQLADFIRRLSARLAKGAGQFELSVVLPKVNRGPGLNNNQNTYNIDTLQKYVDFFTLTAYDFTTGDYAPGAIAPLFNPDRVRLPYGSIEDVVYNYLEAGMPREKLLVGLPYYGGKWTRLYNRSDGKDTTLFEHLTFREVSRMQQQRGAPKRDYDAWASYYRESVIPPLPGYDEATEITWFDDRQTLSRKYDWVLEQELGGVGIWALGYDAPDTTLWGLLDEKFVPVNDTLVYYNPAASYFYLPSALLRYRDVIAISGLFVFLFLAIGFIWALFDWRVRDVFFTNKTLRILYIVATFALVTATCAFFLFLNPGILENIHTGWLILLALVVGLVSGTFIVRLINRWFANLREGMP
ncbi:glycosyl hydrolase family 18 protein [Lewinella sp. W8]|uniref:glycosyl hydrolase family 18 protein n=1 Tax=Lewinella sp. W8 TaxID=2528208 RepID=UPI0010687129|nr:glycosyl hydrolase family 18 protein [Lewinella sp. W8]MTB52957.1 hypothetical protein [Lewinella sp. W8]